MLNTGWQTDLMENTHNKHFVYENIWIKWIVDKVKKIEIVDKLTINILFMEYNELKKLEILKINNDLI